ncbi:vWA domain-containing protein [Deinococcus aerophilus]|uniref:VWFA domain-containing protein n=1 Tax=Deinococcus aerophilus TaxID=522488 RepID=A0ABQ2GP23_9DEIO|nr:vWA domain-containing protein [Deinococcus aerophilus]GGM04354.1 hypothetical protein GCM10010841_10870 [Deinococcus aerophilus]
MVRAALLLSVLLSGSAGAQAVPAPQPAALTLQPEPDCVLPAGPLPTRTRAVFLLDTSGSMRGLGDGRANIFEAVKASLNQYVRQQRPDRVELLTFDSGVRSRQGFDRPAGTPQWNRALEALKADGNNTYLYRSVQAALAPLKAGDYLTTVFVLTDGIDNDPGRVGAPQALAAFSARGPLDRLHYVALGTAIPADARAALIRSDYADGQTVPVGRAPALGRPGLGGVRTRTVTDLESGVPVPFADGTGVALAAPGDSGLRLAAGVVREGQVSLRATGSVPYGTAALLCAPPVPRALPDDAGPVAPRSQHVLLRVNLDAARPVRWLNPGADLHLKRGEEALLRYRAARGMNLEDPDPATWTVQNLPPGLDAQVLRLPGAREFAVRLTNRQLSTGQTVTPVLSLPGRSGGPFELTLPAVVASAGGRTPAAPAASSPPTAPVSPAPAPSGQRPFLPVGVLTVLGLAALGLLRLAVLDRRGRRAPPLPRLARESVPAVEGIEYSEGRVLSLVASNGDVSGVAIPLGGSFDLGQLARVPHLSGLRAEQHRDGLRITRLPADLEVSQGARLLRAGDVVRPGTLLGIVVARPARAPQPPLGALAGLGLPLNLRWEGAHVRAAGPYGVHTLTLPPGLSDLGRAFAAPVLSGLKVTLSGAQLLLVEVPAGLALCRSGEPTPLQPGVYLTGTTAVDLPDA